MSDSLWPHGLQHTGLPYSSPSPGVSSNSCPLSHWCHPTISSSVARFSSCPQSFPESGSFPMSQLFASDGQSIGTSASASVLPMNIQGWFPLGLAGLISLLTCREGSFLCPFVLILGFLSMLGASKPGFYSEQLSLINHIRFPSLLNP